MDRKTDRRRKRVDLKLVADSTNPKEIITTTGDISVADWFKALEPGGNFKVVDAQTGKDY